ncbi:BBE domain-containing protein [Glaciecola sp. MF2-115]|uniref:BBE domain-containing protein n=1 Tax=Glaciecola sp. MF2-115 TaxID=3384827 RepID=UPI0039A076FF
MTNVAAQATPWQNRAPHFTINVHTRWQDAKDDESCQHWARTLHDDLSEHSMGSVYVNFIPEGDNDSISEAYGVNFARLKRIKQKVDPANLFRVNQNIVP